LPIETITKNGKQSHIDYNENDLVAHYWRDNVPIIKNKKTYYRRNKSKLDAYKAKQNLKKVAPIQSAERDPTMDDMYNMYADVSTTKRKPSSAGSDQSGPKKQDAAHTSEFSI